MKHILPRLMLASFILAVRSANAAPAWPDTIMRDNMIIRPERLMQAEGEAHPRVAPRLLFAGYAVASHPVVFRPTPMPDPTPIPEPSGLPILGLGGLMLLRIRRRSGKADSGRG